jgi:hypothetical protein
MISLLYLKYGFNESDEGVSERWGEIPPRQYLSGLAYFEHRWLYDPTTLIKFSKAIGEEGVEESLTQTIDVALSLKLIKPKHLLSVTVDISLQPKVITHPTDSRLLEVAPTNLVDIGIDFGRVRREEENINLFAWFRTPFLDRLRMMARRSSKIRNIFRSLSLINSPMNPIRLSTLIAPCMNSKRTCP